MTVSASLREILDVWHAAEADPARAAQLDRLMLARNALALGHASVADEIARDAAAQPDASAELRYTAALAAARIGALRRAQRWVDALLLENLPPALRVDALSLAGRIAKDRWARLRPGLAREEAGHIAIARYSHAWQASRDPFPGINAATLLWLGGDTSAARALARDVRDAAAHAPDMATHWREATLGEAALLLGDTDAAAQHYRAAADAARGRAGDIASMRRQLRLIQETMTLPESVHDALALPRVAVFTGHMLDTAGRSPPRFPPELEARVAAAIAKRIDDFQLGFGYCSAACGSDLLFVEAMLERGAEIHLVLPFDREEFVATSVAFAGPAWVKRFDRALALASSVTYGVRERYLGDDSLFAYAGALMQGAALLRAHELESEPLLLAVADESSERRAGGATDLLASWSALGLRTECIDITALRGSVAAGATSSDAPESVAVRAGQLRREVRTMLFADMVGYSRLAEEDTPSFLSHFLGAIADIVAKAETPPQFVNTWGDGLFMVFDDVAIGAGFALQLRDAVAQCDWSSHGLPADTSIRIGMHTGPVFHAFDRLIGRDNYFGAHVIRAARIEPVVAPGAVYVSAELAFLLAARGAPDFATDYLGSVPLAKGHGQGVLYRLRGAGEAE